MTILKQGDIAPQFSGINQHNSQVSLSDFRGKKVILYFYPKDNTPGCTAEACDLNNNYHFWLEKGFKVVGVSPDNTVSHKKFADKFGLQFDLLADTGLDILNSYGVWGEKKMYGKSYMGVIRTTFVIDENGIIEEIFSSVDTKNHTRQITSVLNL
jgi:thioredoxin-dependent peroxiredoxin